MKGSLTNMLLALGSAGILSAAILAGVHELTSEPIARAAEQARETAIADVLPAFDKTGETLVIDSLDVTPAFANGHLAGAAVKSYSMDGFSGRIDVMVGFDAEGKISGYHVLSHNETPGLGAKMADWFKDPAADRSIIGKAEDIKMKADGGDIDAITAATISSRAFADAVNRARRAYEAYITTRHKQ